jgi:hypothetical protein
MQFELKLRIPLPKKTEGTFKDKNKYTRKKKYVKKVVDYLEDIVKDQLLNEIEEMEKASDELALMWDTDDV